MPLVKNVGDPCAGKSHARFDVGGGRKPGQSAPPCAPAPPADPTATVAEGLPSIARQARSAAACISRPRSARSVLAGSLDVEAREQQPSRWRPRCRHRTRLSENSQVVGAITPHQPNLVPGVGQHHQQPPLGAHRLPHRGSGIQFSDNLGHVQPRRRGRRRTPERARGRSRLRLHQRPARRQKEKMPSVG